MVHTLAWIGLGNMGRGMSKNLVLQGQLVGPLILFNRSIKRATDLCNSLPLGKSIIASSVAEAVSKSDIIFTCLSNDTAIEETINMALKGNVKGKLFVDCSTVSPDTTERLEKNIIAAGAEFVACPVFGAPAMAENGQLICVLAGTQASVEKVKPYTKGVIGKGNIDFSGQPASKASLLKVIGNTFVLNIAETLAEGHVLAEKTGLGTENLQKFIEALFPGPYTAYSTRMLSGEYYKRAEPLFAADLARKDARHALALAKATGTKLKAVEVEDAHLGLVIERMDARGDLASIYGVVRQEAGLKFEN